MRKRGKDNLLTGIITLPITSVTPEILLFADTALPLAKHETVSVMVGTFGARAGYKGKKSVSNNPEYIPYDLKALLQFSSWLRLA